MSQPAMAAVAGASRSAVVSWEKGASTPTASSLSALAEAGYDILFIVTARRTEDRPDNPASEIKEKLAAIRRDMLDPLHGRQGGADDTDIEKVRLLGPINRLKSMLNFDRKHMSEDLQREAVHLLDIIENPASLALFRAADRVQLRRKRESVRNDLQGWFEGDPSTPDEYRYQPGEAVLYLLTTLAIEYVAPVRLLVELIEEVERDVIGKAPAPAAGIELD